MLEATLGCAKMYHIWMRTGRLGERRTTSRLGRTGSRYAYLSSSFGRILQLKPARRQTRCFLYFLSYPTSGTASLACPLSCVLCCPPFWTRLHFTCISSPLPGLLLLVSAHVLPLLRTLFNPRACFGQPTALSGSVLPQLGWGVQRTYNLCS
jgi:hypothetical protein